MGNTLTSLVNVTVRKTFRRIATGKLDEPNGNGVNGVNGVNGINGHTNGAIMPDERSPLLPGAHPAGPASDNSSFWWAFFLDNTSTPGTDNPNPLVRWPAQSWNVFKVTLLSCTYTRQTSRDQFLMRARLCSLDQPPSRLRTDRNSRRQTGLGRSMGFYAQLLRHHPAGCRSFVCDRRDRASPGRNTGRACQCDIWQRGGTDRACALMRWWRKKVNFLA